MKRVLLALVPAFMLFASAAFAMTTADEAALRELTKQYASWVYSGRPVEFRNRLDYDSYEEQRRILIRLAEIEWRGLWGDYWLRREVDDLKTLRAFSPNEFWQHFHGTVRPLRSGSGGSIPGRTSVEVECRRIFPCCET